MLQVLRRLSLVLVASLACVVSVSTADDFPPPVNSPSEAQLQPMAAEEAAARMILPPGFTATVFAAEPDVQNPIAMAWDDAGRLWVAENYTYSDRQERFNLALRDRVVAFADHDHDGRADERTVFTDDVQMLTSVEVGRGGVWLMCPPALLFIPDVDADLVPDGPARVVLDGFTVARDNYHNFANGLRWGPDGWLYGRCGHSCPGRLGTPGTADSARIPIDGGIWRFHPGRGIVEVLCHGTVNPWGHDWDRHGELYFINTVIGHLWHMLPGSHFKESFGESQNPAVYERLDMIADHYHFDTAAAWSESRDGKANDLGGGHAHIGTMIYQHGHWPAEYHDRLFTLNMHGRRANQERLERFGAGYIGRHEPDFLISEDPFFRGMEIGQGPDGNVFVLDWSDTGECHEHTGVHRTSGRIFKITYGTADATGTVHKPQCLAGEGPLPLLWRDYKAGVVTRERLFACLRDPDEHVRAWGIRLLTDFWPLDTIMGPRAGVTYADDPEMHAELVRLAHEDESGLVLLVVASTLQRLPIDQRVAIAKEVVQREEFAADRQLPSMVWFGLIPVGERNPGDLLPVADVCRFPSTLEWIARFIASRGDAATVSLGELLATAGEMPEPLQDRVLLGMHAGYRGWHKASAPPEWEAFRESSSARTHAELTRDLAVLFGDGRALDDVRRIVLDEKGDLRTRQTALATLITANPPDLRPLCESLLTARVINLTAARGLAKFDDPEVGRLLAENYRRFQPEDRPAILETLASRPSFALALLDQMAADSAPISPGDISPDLASRIQGLHDEQVTARLSEVWGELRDTPEDRRERMSQLRGHLDSAEWSQADASHGRALFAQNCARCHVLFGEGAKVGPDLTGSQRANFEYLLENLVDPSAVVGRDFRMSIVVTEDGRTLSGQIVSRDERILVLQTPTEQLTLPVAEVLSVQETTLSPMPDGLLDRLTPAEVRDLFAYLSGPTQVPATEGSAE
jgi:putative membrane-bound dehydrogenase-like protein